MKDADLGTENLTARYKRNSLAYILLQGFPFLQIFIIIIIIIIIISILCAFARLQKATSSLMSVRLSARGNTAPAEGISVNLIFEYFSKICRENSSLLKILQE